MTAQIPLSRIHSAARVVGASRGMVNEGISGQSAASRQRRARQQDQRSGTV